MHFLHLSCPKHHDSVSDRQISITSIKLQSKLPISYRFCQMFQLAS